MQHSAMRFGKMKYCAQCKHYENALHEGYVSVYQSAEAPTRDLWFCSYQCLFAFKYGDAVYRVKRESEDVAAAEATEPAQFAALGAGERWGDVVDE